MSDRRQIKGGVLLSRLDFVRERAGDDALQAIIKALPEPDRKVLTGLVLPSSWYPFDTAARLEEAIAALLSPDDHDRIFLEMGRASADANLLAHHAVFVRKDDPQHLLSCAPQIYSLYYHSGRRTYEKTGPNSAVLKTFDAEQYSANDCLTVVGWHRRAIELSGGREAQVTETQCRDRGADYCEYRCEWK
jgi:uncharacterized protein (TIGR02265 family)